MTQRYLVFLTVPALLLLCVNVTHSHHAFSPVYDENESITVEGVVIEFRLVNPHAMMTLDVTDETGDRLTWTVEFAGRLNLTVGGWKEDTISVGERVTVDGNPSHTGSPKLFFRRLVRSDGTELLPPSAQRNSAIEAERRQRAQQRDRPD